MSRECRDDVESHRHFAPGANGGFPPFPGRDVDKCRENRPPPPTFRQGLLMEPAWAKAPEGTILAPKARTSDGRDPCARRTVCITSISRPVSSRKRGRSTRTW